LPSATPFVPLEKLPPPSVEIPTEEPAVRESLVLPKVAPKPSTAALQPPLVLDSDLSSLSFERASDAIDSDVAADLDKLAKILQKHESARITLNAYAGADGEITPREARRISLGRALNVRDYLAKRGVSSNRIDVRALGANVPSGDMDRVDIKIN
jgi:outer membrane protein OmpA-like peptidoglycan-associated protein